MLIDRIHIIQYVYFDFQCVHLRPTTMCDFSSRYIRYYVWMRWCRLAIRFILFTVAKSEVCSVQTGEAFNELSLGKNSVTV